MVATLVRTQDDHVSNQITYVVKIPEGTYRIEVKSRPAACPDCDHGERFSGSIRARSQVESRIPGMQCRTCDGEGSVLDDPGEEAIREALTNVPEDRYDDIVQCILSQR
jgi:hypothetical protein